MEQLKSKDNLREVEEALARTSSLPWFSDIPELKHTMGSRNSPGPTLAQAGMWYYSLGSRNQAREEERKERRKGEQEGQRKRRKKRPSQALRSIVLRFECEMAPTGSALSSQAHQVELLKVVVS